MMTQAEQTAFIDAYAYNVANAPREVVEDFVTRYVNGEDINYSSDYTSIMDALGVWHSAMSWSIKQNKEALTLSLSELHRHAIDTESGDKAIASVERVLKGLK